MILFGQIMKFNPIYKKKKKIEYNKPYINEQLKVVYIYIRSDCSIQADFKPENIVTRSGRLFHGSETRTDNTAFLLMR